ncbi:hypothetical protein HYW21_03675 [Candidatus Woesearchaeota archaeon]|nr:hypothetical protein [Candidatus Woesearchaeota archaeon]
MTTITKQTEQYIKTHLAIKDCLKKGLINYSALSRQISKELQLQRSHDAILIAARRFREKLQQETQHEEKIISLFQRSQLEIKNRITTLILEKTVYPDSLIDVEKEIKKKRDIFFVLEGTKTITIITHDQYADLLKKRFSSSLKDAETGLSMIIVVSPGIEKVPGAIAYVTGLFFEHGVNIKEFMSCWDDTIFVIKTVDVPKVVTFLQF